jgi:hypothetical protein
MTIRDLIDACGFERVLVPDEGAEVSAAYTSDLLSDAMAHCPDGAVLVTVQNHTNAVAVCTLVGAPAILIVHAREVPAEMRAAASREGVALLRTKDDQFGASCRLGAALGLLPIDRSE